jgi:hypothetical protein
MSLFTARVSHELSELEGDLGRPATPLERERVEIQVAVDLETEARDALVDARVSMLRARYVEALGRYERERLSYQPGNGELERLHWAQAELLRHETIYVDYCKAYGRELYGT